MRGKTVLVISHRASVLALADRAVLLRDGAIAEEATPAELRARARVFAQPV